MTPPLPCTVMLTVDASGTGRNGGAGVSACGKSAANAVAGRIGRSRGAIVILSLGRTDGAQVAPSRL